MKVNLVKRNKIIHLGMPVKVDKIDYIASVCNRTWCVEDTTSIGETSDVTCKRCMKYAKEAELNNGVVELNPRRKYKK